MAVERDTIETVLSVVDNYTREIERYRNEMNSGVSMKKWTQKS